MWVGWFVYNLANLELQFLGGCESHGFTPHTQSVLQWGQAPCWATPLET